MKRLLLLTGIPGTGKTSAGDELQANHGFKHFNVEQWMEAGVTASRSEDLLNRAEALSSSYDDVVISWGFVPQVCDAIVRELQKRGYIMFWFDGNKKAALREFNKRGTVSEALFHVQMAKIANLNITSFNPKRFNPFTSKGLFRSRKLIALALLRMAKQ